MLISMKIQSGRLTDFRDIPTLAKRIDLDKIKSFLFIGDQKALHEKLNELAKSVKDKNFVNLFKGVFIEKKFYVDMKQVEQISKLKQ